MVEFCYYYLKNNTIKKPQNTNYGYKMWKYLTKGNKSEKCFIFINGAIVNYKGKLKYSSLFTNYYKNDLKTNYSDFPHNSYSRLFPSHYDKNNILLYTYDIQHYIYNHQHPVTCEDKKYLLIKGYYSGHGSQIHIIASYLAVAFDSNRIAVYDPSYISLWTNGKYCENISTNWNCFFEPITNCTLSLSDINKAVKYLYINQTEKVVYLNETSEYLYIIPQFISEKLLNTIIHSSLHLKFWIIQATTYIVRLNVRTYNFIINNYSDLEDIRSKSCMNVWIRHGDKYYEMELITSENYSTAIDFHHSFINPNTIVYLSTDDPTAITEMNSKYQIKYIHYKRINNKTLCAGFERGSELTLNVLADLMASISCSAFVGTRSSNINRLVDELRMTVGFKSDFPYYEIGRI